MLWLVVGVAGGIATLAALSQIIERWRNGRERIAWISVRRNGVVYLDGRPVASIDELERLLSAAKLRVRFHVVIVAESRSTRERLAEVRRTLRRLGIRIRGEAWGE